MAPCRVRIYADFNGIVALPGNDRSAVVLDTWGTSRDLALAGCRLAEGMALTVYDRSTAEEDLEASGVVRWDAARRRWALEYDVLREVPARARNEDAPLVCLACRRELAGGQGPGAMIRRFDARCACGGLVHAAIAPPDAR